MIRLLPHIKSHFESLDSHLSCFHDLEVQVEGWFKGELLFLLARLKREGLLQDFKREIKIDHGRVDLSITIEDAPHWVELKHWLCGVQRGVRLNPIFYFGDRTSVGILPDVNKLLLLHRRGQKWILILATKNPGVHDWNKGLETFHRKFRNRHLWSQSEPNDFSPTYFLGLLKIAKGSAVDDPNFKKKIVKS